MQKKRVSRRIKTVLRAALLYHAGTSFLWHVEMYEAHYYLMAHLLQCFSSFNFRGDLTKSYPMDFPVTWWHITFIVTHNHWLKELWSTTGNIQNGWVSTFYNIVVLTECILEGNFIGVIGQTCNSTFSRAISFIGAMAQIAGHQEILNYINVHNLAWNSSS
jgi:hypothetical protein